MLQTSISQLFSLTTSPPSPCTQLFLRQVHGNAPVICCFPSVPITQISYPTIPSTPTQSSHYQSNIWSHDFVESLQSDHVVINLKSGRTQIEKLKEDVRDALGDDSMVSLEKLKLIDALQRLGLGYHFEKEIKTALDILCHMNIDDDKYIGEDLHSTAMFFRILRQHGYEVSQDVFNAFMDHKGSFKANLHHNVEGLLNLYEASHLCFEGENILSEAKAFSITHLKLFNGNIDPGLAEEVTHALELPLHWRMPRLEGRWYINAYQNKLNMKPSLLEFAKLDFNLVQANHQKELSYLSRWWRHLGLARKLSFARDRLVECFFVAMGLTFEPQFECCRERITKVISFILTLDDIYDIYGSLDELELFTVAVERWDLEAMEKLPDYMKICFYSLYNTINEMADTTQKEQGWDTLPYLKKEWADFCKAMLIEAKWSKKSHTPSLQEYLANAWVSSSVSLVLVHAFFATKQRLTTDALECLENNSDLIYYSSMIFRLCNDIATSSAELERGDVPSAIQCYMRETNVSEEVAREDITVLLTDMWKKLNKSISDSPFSLSFVNIAMNLMRTAHCIYQFGDGIGVQDHEVKERIMVLLVKSI